jgi:hypothetical protein
MTSDGDMDDPSILESLADSDKTRYVARSGVCYIYAALGRLDRAAREWTIARAEGDWELGWAPPAHAGTRCEERSRASDWPLRKHQELAPSTAIQRLA